MVFLFVSIVYVFWIDVRDGFNGGLLAVYLVGYMLWWPSVDCVLDVGLIDRFVVEFG